ncbi:TlpA disulfide reductase family protein [Tunicatimonas pelagia]|uniref:TlpA disulfide reductase family protein n=1 Tax=Tunicatimonas pelagia TaxID=931531 RepID=UPI0026651B11|nr:TlpA disulfide reductase family protein [Tunicatimonas pelagia]WKN41357.1 TlpA disulfide reductase family protein [Tunicatimonas pelagia]
MILRTNSLIFALAIALAACTSSGQQPSSPSTLTVGKWRATLELPGQVLPFTFDLREVGNSSSDTSRIYELYLENAEEKLRVDEVYLEGDSVRIPMHIFDTEIVAKNEGDRWTGYWRKNYEEDYQLPFEARLGDDYRFALTTAETPAEVSGKWAVQFADDSLASVGIFEQQGNRVTGSFLTATGDYRFLEGNVVNDELLLSTFDGEHAFLFRAKIQEDGSLQGDFWSGSHYHTNWTAERDENAALADANSLIYLKEGYDRLAFTFPDLQGDSVSLSNPKYNGKVVLVQIFGTWCPNCMDETKFLADWYRKNRDRGVEIIGLAYEQKDDFSYAQKRVQKMVDKLGVEYDFLIAGTSDKEQAAETLPMLNRIMSFPTLIYIDQNGEVANIHTGFSGPGTGEYYEAFVQEFNERMDALLEQPS